MMVGYSTNRKGSCYKMYDSIKGYACKLRDVIWLKQMYFPNQVSHNDNESKELMPWLEDQDLDSTVTVTADQGSKEKTKEDNTDVTSNGENDGVIEMDDELPTPHEAPVPSVTQPGQ
eukprot:570986-Ditylum_brightwellii.AAC.1